MPLNKHAVLLGLLSSLAVALFLAHGEPAAPIAVSGPATPSRDAALQPMVEAPPEPELALLMGTLQTLTHKLALSADAGNSPLAGFYVHESLEQLKAIQKEAPEYEGLPIAALVERMALPAYSELQQATAFEGNAPRQASRDVLLAGLDKVIESCNSCHAATQHGFIKITRGTDVNPFNQSFQP